MIFYTLAGYICLIIVLFILAHGLYEFGKFDDIEELSPLNKVLIPVLGIISIFSKLGTNNIGLSLLIYTISIILVGIISYFVGYRKRNSN
jgi:hypothetical protein